MRCRCVRGTHQLKFGGQIQRVGAAVRSRRVPRRENRIRRELPRRSIATATAWSTTTTCCLRSRSGAASPIRIWSSPTPTMSISPATRRMTGACIPQLTLNLGVRYEIDTDVNNISRVDQLNPIVAPFVNGRAPPRHQQLGPAARVQLVHGRTPRTSVRGGYGIYYDRITLEIQSLERGLDGRALPIEVRAGNVFFMDPATGRLPPFAPSVSNPFTGLHPAGRRRIRHQHHRSQTCRIPMVQQMSLGLERQIGIAAVAARRCRAQSRHRLHHRPGRWAPCTIRSSADRTASSTWSRARRRTTMACSSSSSVASPGRFGLRASYTLSKSHELRERRSDSVLETVRSTRTISAREYGPAPNDQRHRLVVSGTVDLGGRFQLAGLWTMASGVPMDILMPDGQSRIPTLSRNAGGRRIQDGGRAERLHPQSLNATGGIDGEPLPLVSESAPSSTTASTRWTSGSRARSG